MKMLQMVLAALGAYPLGVAPRGGAGMPAAAKRNLPANWKEQMRQDAEAGRKQVAKMGVSQRLKTQGGILMYMDAPVPGNAMDAVILAGAPENSYYEGAFDPQNTTPPVCYAFGRHDTVIDQNGSGLSPHPDSPKPQAKTCAECKWNKFGTAEKGKGKACKNSVQVMLFHADALKKKGPLEAEVVSLSVPPTSGAGYKAWLGEMEQLGPSNLAKYGFVSNISVTPRQQGGHFVNLHPVRTLPEKVIEQIFPIAKQAEKDLNERPAYPKEDEAAKGGKQGKPKRKKY